MHTPRPYQYDAVQSFFDYFANNGRGNPLIAMPTGTGKSLVIAFLIYRILQMYPLQRIMVLTHVKELIEQNSEELFANWPSAPAGIYSSGLKRKDLFAPVTFGGVQSVINVIEKFGWIDLLFIDEAHLLGPNDAARYNEIIKKLKARNPYLKVVGLTATPWRQGIGHLTNGGIFTDVIYDITGVHEFNKLIQDGYLSMLVPRRTRVTLDVSNVGMSNGDYALNQLISAVDVDDVTYAACEEFCQNSAGRTAGLVFCAGNHHAEKAAEFLRYMGVRAECVHSKIKNRDEIIRDFKAGDYDVLTNNNVLTTGFNHRPIDIIGMMRPTTSVGLWVQMLGRGTRPSPETKKENCLVLDYAGNTVRLGPINDPYIPEPGKKRPGEAPVKVCDRCGTYNHASARVCTYCGLEFERSINITGQSSTAELIASDSPVVETYNVQRVTYYRHEKQGSPDSLRVTYYCEGLKVFSEWVPIEHPVPLVRHKAREWFRQRHYLEPPDNVEELLSIKDELRVPKFIRVWINKKYPEILSAQF